MRKLILFILTVVCIGKAHSQSDTLPKSSIGYFLTKALQDFKEKKYVDAFATLDSAIKRDSTNKNIYSLKAEFCWLTKDYNNAAANFQKSMTLDKDSSYLKGAYVFLGVLYEKAGHLNEAQKNYKQAVFLFENNSRKDDRIFEFPNILDYVTALKLLGIIKKWEGLMSHPGFAKYHDMYKEKSRDEVLAKYWAEYDGG